MIDVARNADGDVQSAPTEHFVETQVYVGQLTVQYTRTFIPQTWLSTAGATITGRGPNQIWSASR